MLAEIINRKVKEGLMHKVNKSSISPTFLDGATIPSATLSAFYTF